MGYVGMQELSIATIFEILIDSDAAKSASAPGFDPASALLKSSIPLPRIPARSFALLLFLKREH
jgi:hypothetical protein